MTSISVRIATAIRLALLGCMGFLFANVATALPLPPSIHDCNGSKDLIFAAHLDDDLLFMNPDVSANIDAGGCMLTVYLTASERRAGEDYMLARERGVRAAYAYLANKPDVWTQDTVAVGAYHLTRFTLTGDPKLQLIHMRLKDPWLGKGWGSLTPLSQTESIAGNMVDTLGSYHETYSRADLVATIASIIQGYGPTTVRHLDDTINIPYTELCWRCIGHGHPDHIASARLVRDAIKLAHGNYAEVAYVDYPTQERQINLNEKEINKKTEAFRRYAWKDYHACPDPQNCIAPAGPEASWVGRSYYVSRHNITPALFTDPEGGILILAKGEVNDAANIWNSRKQTWSALGGRTPDSLASFAYPDAANGFLARDALGIIWANKQNPDESWQGWQAMVGARFPRLPTVTSEGKTAAVGLANDGLLYWATASSTENRWAAWQPLPVLHQATSELAITTDAAGRLVIFATDVEGRLFTVQQIAAKDAEHWSSWNEIAAPIALGGLAALRNAHGLIELYLRDRANNHLLRIAQAAQPDSAANTPSPAIWNTATDLGVSFVGKPAVGLNEHGDVIVAVVDHPDGALWLYENDQAKKLSVNVVSSPALRVINGVLYIVARNAGQLQTYQVQEYRQGVWGTALTIAVPPAGGGSAFSVGVSGSPLVVVTDNGTQEKDN